jgi:hypothetical protein
VRAISYENLIRFADIILVIERANNDEQLSIAENLITELSSNKTFTETDSKNILDLLTLLKTMNEALKKMQLEDDYINSFVAGTSFDLIRRYTSDLSTGLLQDVRPENFNDVHLYSQLADVAKVIQVRTKMNDSDYNRAQYVLEIMSQRLSFKTNMAYDKTIKVTNAYMCLLCMLQLSELVPGFCVDDLRNHYFSQIMDILIRSRIIADWRRTTFGRAMLASMKGSKIEDEFLIEMCNTETAKDRAALVIRLLAKDERCKKFARMLNYDTYITALEKTSIVVDSVAYYVLGTSFLIDVTSSQTFDALYNLSVTRE